MYTLLIIEDNCTLRENTAELLEMEGYSIITATNGNNGFKKIKDYRPDIVIGDILMPEMDGLELLRKLGLHPDLKSIPFIFFSAKNEKKDIKTAMDLGAYDYIVKPSDLEGLLASIQRCLKSKAMVK
ncbi:MAG: response regulator [Maribacter sp.]